MPPAHPADPSKAASRRALVVRVGALGDVLLTRRLTYSLSLAGIRSTLFAPSRHASLLIADPWIDGVLDSESPRFANAFAGEWPERGGTFDLGVVISQAVDLVRATASASTSVIQIAPGPGGDGASITQQWAEAASEVCVPFKGTLPLLTTDACWGVMPNAAVIHPGSGSPSKNWPWERFVELGRALKNEGQRVVWIRGPAEADLPREVSDFERLDRLSLEELAATLAQSSLFIGNDSGVSHLAAAVGAPTIAIFGPTSDLVWRPDGPRVRTIRSRSGELAHVSVDEVLAAIEAFTRL